MADRSNENVPRGDHVPGGPNDASAAEMNQKANRAGTDVDSAPNRAHGEHGKGVGGHEEHDDAPDAAPPSADGTDRGGDAGWDGSRAGGSVVDKRSE